MSQLNASSLTKLAGVHPDLDKLVRAAAERKKFIITEGLRTRERQAKLVASGASLTMNSRHITGHAIDFCPWFDRNGNEVVESSEISWKMIDFIPIADVFKEEARRLGIKITWGGDWLSFKDGPHIELERKTYP